jgi:hypothetical protein
VHLWKETWEGGSKTAKRDFPFSCSAIIIIIIIIIIIKLFPVQKQNGMFLARRDVGRW